MQIMDRIGYQTAIRKIGVISPTENFDPLDFYEQGQTYLRKNKKIVKIESSSVWKSTRLM